MRSDVPCSVAIASRPPQEFKLVTSSAVVQGITSPKGTSGGNPFEIDVRFTDTPVKEDGQWRLLVSHVTRVPPQ